MSALYDAEPTQAPTPAILWYSVRDGGGKLRGLHATLTEANVYADYNRFEYPASGPYSVITMQEIPNVGA